MKKYCNFEKTKYVLAFTGNSGGFSKPKEEKVPDRSMEFKRLQVLRSKKDSSFLTPEEEKEYLSLQGPETGIDEDSGYRSKNV